MTRPANARPATHASDSSALRHASSPSALTAWSASMTSSQSRTHQRRDVFHFASKQALASAIVDDLTEMNRAAVAELVARKMSGLETVIDLVYLLAVQDTQNEVARAGVRLLDNLDTTELATTLWRSWVETITTLIQKAATRATSSTTTIRRHRQNAGALWWVSAESATSTNRGPPR